MAITGSEKAYRYARAGIARAGATRSNYVAPNISALLWHYTPDGTKQTLDLAEWIQYGTLTITQAINNDPDTCSLTLIPERDGGRTMPIVPEVGDVIFIGFAAERRDVGVVPSGTEFSGTVAIKQHTRRQENRTPWIALTLQDWLWQFDARFVTTEFPRQSASETVEWLVWTFINQHEVPSGGPVFGTTYVQKNLPVVEAFAVEMWRPSTVLRRVVTAIGGGFYIDANRELHVWGATAEEYGFARPQPLTNTVPSLKSFRHTVDATQIRHRVIVEGQRTTILTGMPLSSNTYPALAEGLPVGDATIFNPPDTAGAQKRARLGAQWVAVAMWHTPTPSEANPPGAHVTANAPLGSHALMVDAYPFNPVLVFRGWIKVGDQYLFYSGVSGTAAPFQLNINQVTNIGMQTTAILEGESVSWPDFTDLISGYQFPSANAATGYPRALRQQPYDTPFIIYAMADASQAEGDRWPHFEALVQDGRYSYAGAQQRADADLAEFLSPLLSAEWETTDRNAVAGRSQVINLTDVDPVNTTITILSVTITFTMRSHPPRRRCSGGHVKQSTLLDVIVTSQA